MRTIVGTYYIQWKLSEINQAPNYLRYKQGHVEVHRPEMHQAELGIALTGPAGVLHSALHDEYCMPVACGALCIWSRKRLHRVKSSICTEPILKHDPPPAVQLIQTTDLLPSH